MVLVALSVYRGLSLGKCLDNPSVSHFSSSLYMQEMVITQIKQAWYCVVGFTGSTMIAMGVYLTWIS
ncbi:hypothetical protein [Acinetobacter nosocomialis]|uniref:hypothetical protein n=1 Tax=Acinetobacter nosocomialis TaxID=106654 RepID=UPI0033A5C7C9